MPGQMLWAWDTNNNVWVKIKTDSQGRLYTVAVIDELDDIGDVNVPTPTDGHYFYWDSGAGEWKSKSVAADAVAAVEAAGLTLAATKKIIFANDGVIQLGVETGAPEIKGGLASAYGAVLIQPKDGNTTGRLYIYPKGTDDHGFLMVLDAADPDNAGWLTFDIHNALAQISAGKTGTGTAPTFIGFNVDITPYSSVTQGLGNASYWWKHINALYHKIASTPSPDHSWSGEVSCGVTAGENLVFGDAVYMKADGKAWKADADAAATMPIFGIAVATINAEATGEVLTRGWIRDDSWSLTAGGIVYASVTAGAISGTAPVGAGDQVQVIGVAMTTASFLLNPSFELVQVPA